MKQITKRKAIIIVLGIFFACFTILNANFQDKNLKNINNILPDLRKAGYWEIEPIFIDDANSNSNWSKTANDYWWCHGLGTWEKPYIIENVTIDGKDGDTNCIEIQNSNIYFIVRNCTLYNSSAGGSHSGIYLDNVRNGTITNNTIGNNMGSGVVLSSGSINNTIFKNTIKNTGYCVYTSGYGNGNNSIIENYIIDGEIRLSGSSNFNNISNNHMSENSLIRLYGCNDNTLLDNIITRDGYFAILLDDCERIKLNRNSMNGAGLSVTGSIEQKTSHIIDTSNLVNNKTLYYYINKDNLKPNNFTDAGQVILINCNNSLISYLNISQSASRAISIHYGMNNTITHNNISSQKYRGIYLCESNYNNISKNILTYNIYGIALYGSNYNNISENIADYNILRDVDGRGLYLLESNYNTISNNYFTNSLAIGLHLEGSQNNIISYNNINNNRDGIKISSYNVVPKIYSINNVIFGNTFFNNSVYGAKLYSGQQYNQFVKNTFIENGINANDDGSNNQWDNGTMGNYWDDYGGKDLDGDGIGDTPYNISGSAGSQDNFPIWEFSDEFLPNISINSPTPNQIFGTLAPDFNVEIYDENLHSMWYTIDGGLNNYTFISNNSIDQAAWDLKPNGTVTIRFYADDKVGNIGFAEVTIGKDVIAPTININSPIPNELYGTSAPSFNVEIYDANLDSMWYTLDNGLTNTIFTTNGTIYQYVWDALLDGTLTIIFYANDSAGNIRFAEVTIGKDVTAPIITINSPQNGVLYGNIAPNFDISIEEPNLDKTWYSLNGGNNITFTGLTGTINQALWDALSDGNVIIRFFANDTLGRIGFQEITVVKMTSQPSPPGIPGYNILLFLGIVSTIVLIIVKKRLNRLN